MNNRSCPGGAVVPTLIYDDVEHAATWLCRAFGFRMRIRAGDSHAQLVVGEGSVMLGQSRMERLGDGATTLVFGVPVDGRISQSIMVAVDDVVGHHRRAKEAGARIVQAPTDHFYGERQYTALDPAGHRWTFSESIDDVDPATWGAAFTP